MESKPKPTPSGIDMSDLVMRLVKYLLEGLAVAVAAYVIPAPSVGSSARQGAGFGIGAGLVGFPA
jgi:hypothetical protein